MYYYVNQNELYHHGILGMHWGVRRFQPYPKGHKGGKEVGEAAKVKTKKKRRKDPFKNSVQYELRREDLPKEEQEMLDKQQEILKKEKAKTEAIKQAAAQRPLSVGQVAIASALTALASIGTTTLTGNPYIGLGASIGTNIGIKKLFRDGDKSVRDALSKVEEETMDEFEKLDDDFFKKYGRFSTV